MVDTGGSIVLRSLPGAILYTFTADCGLLYPCDFSLNILHLLYILNSILSDLENIVLVLARYGLYIVLHCTVNQFMSILGSGLLASIII